MLESGVAKANHFKSISTWLIKWLSGFFFSFILSTIGLMIMSYGVFSFVFVLVVCQSFFWKIFHDAGLISVLVFDAVFIFLMLALRLYIAVGPNL